MEAKKYKPGNTCYQFYLSGMHSNHGKYKLFAVFNKKDFGLDEEFKFLIQNNDLQER